MANPKARKQAPKPASRMASRSGAKWVKQMLGRMTLEQKLGQLLMVYVWGRFTAARDRRFEWLVQWAAEGKIGGLILQAIRTPRGIDRDQVYPTAILLNQLQRKAKIPLLVGADFETGTAMRLSEGTSLPHAMAIAATGNPRDAYAAGKITALEARAAGVHWVFAPVADVNSNPANPIINIRSFGEEPKDVARLAAEFIRGVQDHGAIATAKHFPGHGDTDVDSHIGLPVIAADRKRLERIEFVPFRAAIREGVGSVMTGHLIVPAVEPDRKVPATLSANIINGVLRREMGFRDLVITDALDMAGVTLLHPPDRVATLAVEAGVDVLLIPPSPEAALESLRDAVRDGRLPIAKIDAAVGRILKAKARLGLFAQRRVDLDRLNERFGLPEFARESLDIADRGVTLLRDTARLLPLDSTRPIRALLVPIAADSDPLPGAVLEEEIRPRVDWLDVRRADTVFHPARTVELPPATSYDVAIVAIFVRVADRKGTVALPAEQKMLVERVLTAGKPAVVACLGSPYLIANFPNAPVWISAFSTQPVAQRAIGRAIFGQVAIRGRLPVSVPGVAAIGAGLSVPANPMTLRTGRAEITAALKPTFELLRRAVAERAFPGGAFAVGHEGHLILHAFGRMTYAPKSAAITPQTIYDVASLTKPVATASVAMNLVESGVLQLDAPVSLYLPEWAEGSRRDWREKAKLADLLRHSAGLPAHREYFREAKGYQVVIRRALAEPLEYEPGCRILYSDIGFMLLGEILRRVSGVGVDALTQARIFSPLGMNHSMFQPPQKMRRFIAPTQNDSDWRKRQVWGEVDDANAYAMGGVAGHAGLFSTAGDLSTFCQMLLNGGIYGHQRLFRRATIDRFTRRETIGDGERALGWDVPTGSSSSGRFFSDRSFGHTGFTGTSIWIDPEKNLFVILLTNRVYPSATNDKIRQVRPALHDAIVEAFGLESKR
jgi:beta-N-acetylhexosaminidase